jgi:hypothetical protein
LVLKGLGVLGLFGVRNSGNGPAILRWVRFSDAASNASLVNSDAMLAMVGAKSGDVFSVWRSSTNDVALSPGQELQIMQFQRTDANAEVFDALNMARRRINIEGCYCSVIGDCWTFTNRGLPQSIAQCPVAPDSAWQH